MVGELKAIDVQTMHWEQLKWGHRYHELRSGETIYAKLEWTQAFGSMARSSSCEGVFTFKRGGFLHPYITIYREGFAVEAGRMNMEWRGSGELVFSSIQRFRFDRKGFASYDYEVKDQRGDLLFDLRKHWGAFKHHGEVNITVKGLACRELGMLLSLCWYLAVISEEDTAAAAAAP